MRIVSVNVGMPREFVWRGAAIRTAIQKEPVDGAVTVGRVNLAGDRQADLTVHGGAAKAVYGYPAEHYEYWRTELPDVTLQWGKFGENLTTEGLSEETLHIGDTLQVGSATLMVTQPRLPCYKLAARFGRDDIIKRFLASGRSGFYFSVLEEGEVEANSRIEWLSRDPERVSITDVLRLYLGQTHDSDLVHRAMKVAALPQSWKTRFERTNPTA